jgi:hypothetical protein
LVNYVASQYDDLLSDREWLFYRRFCTMSEQAQLLYVRMLGRKGSLFRSGKLQYDEIADTSVAALALEQAGLITINNPALR